MIVTVEVLTDSKNADTNSVGLVTLITDEADLLGLQSYLGLHNFVQTYLSENFFARNVSQWCAFLQV